MLLLYSLTISLSRQSMKFLIVTSVRLFLLLHLSLHLEAYTLVDNFTISCGATGKSFDNERTWTGDTDSMLFSPQFGTVAAKATAQASSTNQVPYTTARLSRSQFSYSFPVTRGPKFLRLFFYPSSYLSFPRTEATFTVQSNQFILLDGFNASLYAEVENKETIFREYVIYVDDGQRLILTFTPSSQSNSYAFVNGIEVLSMPDDLYHTSEDDMGFKLLGHDMLFSVQSSAALQTEYRIKVGGQGISPGKDTGLFRNWIGHDEDYLIKPNPEHNDLPGDMDGKMKITVNPDYVAPEELYGTARNMGTNGTWNKMSNLTWVFPVDTGFTYMLRLHFCEIAPEINDIGDRVFIIYIASQVAEDRADVMRWSQKQKGLAVYKNYAVMIPRSDTQKKYNLSLQMHPYGDGMDTLYSDAFLNGLEIFKISDSRSNNLAGPNPDPIHTPQNNQKRKSSSGSETTIIGVVVGVVSIVVLISFFIFFVILSPRTGTWSFKCCQLSFSRTVSTNTLSSSLLPSNLCRRFSLVEMKAATKNFDDVFIVGVGGFGHVYRGYIDSGSTVVAIKRLRPGSQQGAREFMNEIEMLSQLRHRHLVSLIGYCNENNEMILVYDFMSRGNLRDHLYDTNKPTLSWTQRLQICIGAGRGLCYLHTGAKYMIIHRDVKTTNILLDDKWVAKLSDFGLSRIGPTDKSKAHVSSAVKGSFGYLDPDYYNLQRLTEKSDVYSFGVVLFEILCARPPLIHTAETDRLSLANWARHCYRSGTMEQIVDPILKGRIAPECFNKFCEIGVSCLLQDGTQRPSMNDVVLRLEFALQLQEIAEQCENASISTQVVDEKRQENSEDVLNSRVCYGYSFPQQ